MAGRIQLTTKGVQDVYFTEDPDYSYFVQLFKKHTNYASSYVNLDVEGEAEFGKTVRLTIPKDQGDLLKTISLNVELAPIAGADVTRVGYVESIGHAMIEYIDMYIGSERVQRIPSDYLQIYSEQNYTQSKQNALNTLIGKYPDRTSDVPVSSGVILGHLGPATTTRKLFIDIPFYFYRHPELAIPLCAMCYQEVSIEIKFREIADCIVKTTDPTSTTIETVILDYELQSNVIITSNVIAASRDGTTFALNSSGTETIFRRLLKGELVDTTTQSFNGIGEVSQGLNTIINSGGIHRYENGVWNTYNASDTRINTSNVQFSDSGNVIVQVGNGYWTWNGTNYIFTINTNVRSVSGDGTKKAFYDSILGRITVESTLTFISSIVPNNIKMSNNGNILAVQHTNGSLMNLYNYINGEWLPYGQTIGIYESEQMTLTADGNAVFILNPNETSGTGRLYIYNTNTSQWVEVYRYNGASTSSYSFLTDNFKTIIVKNTDSYTDVIKLQEITRSVENYDDIVIKNLENVVNTGSSVFGAGYQGLELQTISQYILNQDSSYRLNTSRTISPKQAKHIKLSDNGKVVILAGVNNTTTNIKSMGVYTRNSITDTFSEISIVINGLKTRVIFDQTETIQSIYSSEDGMYFTTVHVINGYYKIRAYKIKNGLFENVLGQDSLSILYNTTSPIRYINLDTSGHATIISSDVRIYNLENPITTPTTIKPISDVYAVSLDGSIYATYSNNEIKVYNFDDDTKFGLKLNLTGVLQLKFSGNNKFLSAVTQTYTYLYETDGVGWKLYTSLYPSIKDNFIDHTISNDGQTISHISYANTNDVTFVSVHTFVSQIWRRIVYRNEQKTFGSASVNPTMNFYAMTRIENNVINSLYVYELNKQIRQIEVAVDADIQQLYPKQINSCKVCLELVYLDDHERNLLRRTRKDYVITQIQHNLFDIPKSIEEHKFRLNFVNPVKELYFVIKRENLRQYEDFVSVFDYDNDALIAENKLIFYENLKSLELTLNDTPYLDEFTGNFIFLKAIQPAIHHSKTPLIRRFYTYSFACEPEKHYPTGQVNFTLINNQLIKLKVTENTTKDRTLDVYALSYNVLRLDKGMARVLFNTK